MHGNYKEQYGSHSLNRWKERLALQHRHAGMSTGSEPCILRGILSKGMQALMTRPGPSPERGPRHSPQNSKWVFSSYTSHNVLSMLRQCIQCYNMRGQIYGQDNDPMFHTVLLLTGQWPNITYINKEYCKVFNRKEDNS